MDDSLQFDRAELATPAACGSCKTALHDSYFQVAGQTICGGCAGQLKTQMTGVGSRGGRLLRAALLGLGAGALGAAIYYAVLELTGYNIGLVAIVVGVFVGRAVRKGSGGRGGRAYQFMAAGITYLAIASTYLPSAISELRDDAAKRKAPPAAAAFHTGAAAADASEATAPAETVPLEKAAAEPLKPFNPVLAIVLLIGLTLALPILSALGGGLISLLIVGFGVWEAWRLNKRIALEITGPHSIAASPTPPPIVPAAA